MKCTLNRIRPTTPGLFQNPPLQGQHIIHLLPFPTDFAFVTAFPLPCPIACSLPSTIDDLCPFLWRTTLNKIPTQALEQALPPSRQSFQFPSQPLNLQQCHLPIRR